MVAPIYIEVTEQRPWDVMRTQWGRFCKVGMLMGELHWRDKMLAPHFRPGAKGKYGYQPRTRGYLMRKIRAARTGAVLEGGTTDLVYSGKMRDWVLSTTRVTATSKGSVTHSSGPRYLYVLPKKRADPDKRSEITRTLDDERAEIGRVIKEAIGRELALWRAPRTTKIDASYSGSSMSYTFSYVA